MQYHEILLRRPLNGLKRYPAIKCYESSVMPNSEAEQVHVRDLPWTVDPRCIEYSRIEET